MLLVQIEFMLNNLNHTAVCGEFLKVPAGFEDNNDNKTLTDVTVNEEMSGWKYLALLEKSHYHIITMAIRKIDMANIRFNPELNRGQDYDFWLQVSQQGQIPQVNMIFGYYLRKLFVRKRNFKHLQVSMGRF